MAESGAAEVECPVCGEEFDPGAAGGWCTNSDCGEWQYEAAAPDPAEGDPPDDAAEADGDAPDDAAEAGQADEEADGDAPDDAAEAQPEAAGQAPDEAGESTADATAEVEAGADDAAAEADDAAEPPTDDDGETPAEEAAETPDDAADPPEETACPSCDTDVPTDADFCPSCGEDLTDGDAADTCPVCGADIEGDFRFCASCGADLAGEGDTDAGAPRALALTAHDRSIVVRDGDVVGREVRSLLTDAGRPEDEAVRVHREHVRFEREGGQFLLEDLGENPTAVNGDALHAGERRAVEPGDELSLSEVVTLAIERP